MENNAKEVEQFIDSLDYDPDKVLVDAASEECKPSTQQEITDSIVNGTYYVYKRERKSAEKANSDLGFVESLNTEIYPGRLVLCNQHLIDNNPDVLELKRKPFKFGTTLLGSKGFTSNISKSEVDEAITETVKEWWSNNKSGNVTCLYDYKSFEVFNSKQVEMNLGVDTNSSDFKLNINFDMIDKKAARDWIVIFEQPYFTVYINDMTSSIDTIDCDDGNTTVELLKTRGVSDKCPIGFVKSVTYGRKIFAHFHSTDVSLNLKSKLDAFFKDGKLKVDSKNKMVYDEINKNAEIEMLIQGGGTNNCATISIDKLINIIEDNMNFTNDQRYIPISYSVRFLKNAGSKNAIIKKFSTYDELTVEKHNRVTLVLKQTGGYVGKMFAEWDTYRYCDENGNPYPDGKPHLTHTTWNYGDTSCTSEDSKEISGNVTNLHIKGEVYKHPRIKFWNKWFHEQVLSTVYENSNLEIKGSKITFVLTGKTLFTASYKIYYDN